MVRAAVFDPTAGQAFLDQARRYDFALLRAGYVHRCEPGAALAGAVGELRRLGYLVREVDGSGWRSGDDLHAALAEALDFPDYYGRNLDALDDVLHDLAGYEFGGDPASTGTVLAVDAYDHVVTLNRRLAHGVLDCFAGAARYGALLGHPMLCLVGARGELDPVGATPVSLVAPPD